ncbi:MAG TPA: twin-arginine translocase subunit TatC [Anaerolineae bacterium]|nr:twin-arginine translocase subunit TatC [Anaerolineae bacterium]HQI86678.1 twin-arginine translocase subunit TatC [Anaerolineae bacterium]HQK13432.1 twin-arginine translocase subunit TatC [Anaerolineae bacterium]
MTEAEMTLLDHIQELRQRLFRMVIAIVVATIAASLVVDYVVAWLVKPLGGAIVVALSPTEAPMTYFKIALGLGFGASLPYILYQIYAFVAPGLFAHERKTFLLGLPAVLIFFILGAIFTLQILVPVSMPVLMGFFGTVITPTYSLEKYLGFVTTLVLWMGLLFQTPLVIYVIALLGVVTPQQLRQAWRVVVFVAAIFAAVVTPTTDPITMLLVTGPFIVLYWLGILLASLAAKQRARRMAAAEAESEADS